jgi:predicted DNA-binding transcriptional regulator AlpA
MQKTQTQTPATTTPVVSRTEILTIDELAAWLKCSKRSVYELTRKRGQLGHDIPLPVLRLPCGMRFRRLDIEAWLQRYAEAERR